MIVRRPPDWWRAGHSGYKIRPREQGQPAGPGEPKDKYLPAGVQLLTTSGGSGQELWGWRRFLVLGNDLKLHPAGAGWCGGAVSRKCHTCASPVKGKDRVP